MGFDPKNMSQKEHEQLLGDVYAGYKQRSIPKYEMRGAGDGRASVQTGYQDVTNFDYYDNNEKWTAIADELGIGSINSEQELGTMAHYVASYGKNNNNNEMPEDENISEKPASDTPVQLSNRAAQASAGTSAYEKVLLNKQGTFAIGRDSGLEQQYKDAYQDNLTEEMKFKDPTTFATTKAKYELADRQGDVVADSFNLGLGSSPANKGLKFT